MALPRAGQWENRREDRASLTRTQSPFGTVSSASRRWYNSGTAADRNVCPHQVCGVSAVEETLMSQDNPYQPQTFVPVVLGTVALGGILVFLILISGGLFFYVL